MKHSYLLAGSAMLALSAGFASGDVLITEDFNSVPLVPFESPTEKGGDGTDWSSGLPAGWKATFTGPIGNPVEFQGWRVMDVDSWIATEGNQERATWSRARVGNHDSVLVADPDAYDDGTEIDTALFNAFLQTPVIDLGAYLPGSVTIEFDSFWRNEVTQKGSLDVSYDGGVTFVNLFNYDSAILEDGVVIDERPVLSVNNPGAGSMVFRFALTDGSNDWWWAIDDVVISATPVPEPSTYALVAVGLMGFGLLRQRNQNRR